MDAKVSGYFDSTKPRSHLIVDVLSQGMALESLLKDGLRKKVDIQYSKESHCNNAPGSAGGGQLRVFSD
jgi:hypothetical protein